MALTSLSAGDLQTIRALHAAGRSQDALHACRRLLAAQPDRADVLAISGTLALKLGDVASAEAALRASLALDASSVEAQFNWGNALMRLGRRADAIAAFERVLELRPDFVPALNNLGNALYESRELQAAAAAFRRALELSPKTAHLQRNLGTALHGLADLKGALQCFQRAVALRSDWPKALQSLATTAMECGEWRCAAEACQSWLRLSAANVEALGLRSIALDELGETALADELLDFERLLRRVQLSIPPAGFSSLADFNAALTEQTLAHPTLHLPASNDPRYHCPTLRMTAEFCAGAEGASAALGRLVASAIDDYVEDLARRLPAHPFVAGGPRRFTLKSWATVLDGEGNLEPHVHYASYVSAVYYAKIPSAMDHAQSGAGYLELGGGGPARFPTRVARDALAVEPREGLLLLFPSYFYHHTTPFRAPEPRVAIAFDTAPAP